MRFPVSPRWTSYVVPGSKTQNGRFPSEIALRLKKVCYIVTLCENCLRQSCRAFIDLTIRAKMNVNFALVNYARAVVRNGFTFLLMKSRAPVDDIMQILAREIPCVVFDFSCWIATELMFTLISFFTALHGMQTRSIAMRILSVPPSVCLLNAWVVTKQKKDVQIFIPYKRTFCLVFWEEERLVVGNPFYLKFWVNRPSFSEIADFEPMFARSRNT